MNINDIFASNSNTLKSADLNGQQWLLTIAKWEMKEFNERDGTKKNKLVLGFHEIEKQLVCNPTNAREIALYYGDDTIYWSGRKIIVFVQPNVQLPQGGTGPGLRVRIPPDEMMKATISQMQPQVPSAPQAPSAPPQTFAPPQAPGPAMAATPPSHIVAHTQAPLPPGPNGPFSPTGQRVGDAIPF